MTEPTERPEVEHNKDGSTIVRLRTPIKLDGEELTRVTIPPLTGRHMRRCPIVANTGGDVAIGQLVDFAAQVVLPAGALDEMTAEDAVRCGTEVAIKMGKPPPTGRGSSA